MGSSNGARRATSTAVALVGLGKIGLPLAAYIASRGHRVTGCDVSPTVVSSVGAGRSHVMGEPMLDRAVAEAVRDGRLASTVDTAAAVRDSDVVLVIVPLVVDDACRPDFSSLDAAAQAVGRGLRPGHLVVFETTMPVGTTRGRMKPILEQTSGLRAGADFHLAFSPERLYCGRVFADLERYPKIVGGVDGAATRRAADFYRQCLVTEVIEVADAETAEFAKLAETTYRDVNIAVANQLALYGARRQVGVAEAFRVANTQPFSYLHQPGIGVGGHCIPVYPYFLLHDAAPDELDIVRASRQLNDSMAALCVDRLSGALDGLVDRTVLLLGVAYRENVGELAYSTALRLIPLLREAGAEVNAHDTFLKPEEVAGLGARWVDPADGPPADAVIVQAWHDAYRALDWATIPGLKVVFDGRNALDPNAVREAGVRYLAVGAS
jgi:nucleotide sugar dehydrogenase